MNEPHSATGNAVLVNALSSSMRSTLNGMESVPGLVRQVVEEGSWRNFTTPRGEHVTHKSFESFVTAKPTKGLGYSIDELMRLVADDAETLRLVADLIGRPESDFEHPESQENVWIEPQAQEVTEESQQELVWRDPSDDPEALQESEAIAELDVDLNDPVNRDAFELRSVGKSGGWVWALKVARNVQPSKAGAHEENVHHDPNVGGPGRKVSASEFARRTGWSTRRVMRYHRAWERGIEKHDLPSFDQLKPGMDVSLPPAKTWTECFAPGDVSPERADALVTGAQEAGISVRKVIYAAKSPGAMKAAILADESTAEAARTALLERARNDSELRTALARTIADDPVFRKETAVESRKAERAEYVRHVAGEGKVRTPAGQTLALPQDARQEIAKLLEVVNEPDATPEAVAEAYGTIQSFTTLAVEADPEVQLREQRTKFSKALSTTAKSIQAINPNDLAAVADDDLRKKLIELQKQVNELATMIANEERTHPRT
ncbi:hypothetical protein J7F01_18480 [Streptomyces sp. ISL-22]|uniref:hypothetical protein n=1 Tax=unclassified Streptomyces TaxID=2593676 RepID=UPI001BE6CDB3|nr:MULTISPECIES: hypothetical protein [unclassified Streptomyces]MBT2423144.1 hypothetical protein [Streptomyces sp. ISL-24]MBT2434129.1 hypothetical protein [Streptomyces sp. ISL-22]